MIVQLVELLALFDIDEYVEGKMFLLEVLFRVWIYVISYFSGLVECIVAAASARIGKKVLHLDK